MSTMKLILSNIDSPESILDDIGIIKLVSGELVISSVVSIEHGVALIMPYKIGEADELSPLIPFTGDRCFPFARDCIQTIKMTVMPGMKDNYIKTRETVGLSDLREFWETVKEISEERDAMQEISEAMNLDPVLSDIDVPEERVLH